MSNCQKNISSGFIGGYDDTKKSAHNADIAWKYRPF